MARFLSSQVCVSPEVFHRFTLSFPQIYIKPVENYTQNHQFSPLETTMSELNFYCCMLDQFAETGNELLAVCDQILNGEIEWFEQDYAL